ncbi:ABC transporter permease subunit [Rhodobacteraceae bacterium B1Z28]|uniref:ABC transporter permease subunit n=1 Tax=Ruegeria haliotis TaxID=2747601 RepID=A0ABX2PVB9_9RHOB|nr:ABC transporter permease subunit [Ruegeria haliotis]NVO56974.1 ABC transporter permease subunit [Ruegeria haliotis]
MDLALIYDNWELFARGLQNTIILVSCSLLFGGVLAVPLAMVQAYNVPVLGKLALGYSYVFRGTPLLVQLFIIYYGLAQFETVRNSIFWPVLREPFYCALIGFSLNGAAYASEIFRGALLDVGKGYWEAAMACGMSWAAAFRRIILPIALRKSIPAYSNEVIFVLHGSVLASTITVVDILGAGRQLNGTYYVTYEGFITAAALYMAIVFTLSLVFRALEFKFLRFM